MSQSHSPTVRARRTTWLRASGATRTSTVVALVLMFLSPWSLWLGASTVPESFTASFACAAALGLGAGRRRAAGAAASHRPRPGRRWRL